MYRYMPRLFPVIRLSMCTTYNVPYPVTACYVIAQLLATFFEVGNATNEIRVKTLVFDRPAVNMDTGVAFVSFIACICECMCCAYWSAYHVNNESRR